MNSGKEKDKVKNRIGDRVCRRGRVCFQVGLPWRRGVSVTPAEDGLRTWVGWAGGAVHTGEEQALRPGEAGGCGMLEKEQGGQCVHRCDGPSRPTEPVAFAE